MSKGTHFINKKNYNNFDDYTIVNPLNKTEEFSTSVEINNNMSKNEQFLKFQFSDFLFLLLLVLLSVIAFVKIKGEEYYSRIFSSVVSFAYSNSFMKERNFAYTLYNVLLISVFIITFSILTFVLSDYFKMEHIFVGECTRFLLNFFLVILFFGIYVLLYFILGFLGDFRIMCKKYFFFLFNLFKLLGTLNVFMLFGIIFTENIIQSIFVFLTVGVFISVYILRLYRLILIFLENQFSLYYMILYFCTLEIMPILLIYKILSNNFT